MKRPALLARLCLLALVTLPAVDAFAIARLPLPPRRGGENGNVNGERAQRRGGENGNVNGERMELDEFEQMALQIRERREALDRGDAVELLRAQQYDICEPGVRNCAQEISPYDDLEAYERAVRDPYYGYQVFILIDKSLSEGPGASRSPGRRQAQTMHVFVREGGRLRLASTHPVSTGREPAPNRSDTREGYMRVQNAQASYTSRKYRELMPYSLWFESEYGTAIHQTRPDWCAEKIGARASAGCVRLCPGEAKPLFDLVTGYTQSVPIVLLDKRSGRPIERGSVEAAPPHAIQNGQLQRAPKVISGYPAFVRIINVNTPAKAEEMEQLLRDPTQGFRRYFPALAPSVLENLKI